MHDLKVLSVIILHNLSAKNLFKFCSVIRDLEHLMCNENDNSFSIEKKLYWP